MFQPSPALRAATSAVALIALTAACDRAKPRKGSDLPPGPMRVGATGAPAAPAKPQTPTTSDPLPAPPQWAQAYIGKPMKAVFPNAEGGCVGNTDVVNLRYQGASPGVRIEGWGWEPAAKKPVEHVLLVDDAGKVVGAGETGVARPDVVAARRDITSRTTGWQATTASTSGGIYGYGLLADGKTACRLGHINL